jgi:hypothetical protein
VEFLLFRLRDILLKVLLDVIIISIKLAVALPIFLHDMPYLPVVNCALGIDLACRIRVLLMLIEDLPSRGFHPIVCSAHE